MKKSTILSILRASLSLIRDVSSSKKIIYRRSRPMCVKTKGKTKADLVLIEFERVRLIIFWILPVDRTTEANDRAVFERQRARKHIFTTRSINFSLITILPTHFLSPHSHSSSFFLRIILLCFCFVIKKIHPQIYKNFPCYK